MVGYPKYLNTKADYKYVIEHFPEERWRPHWDALLDERKNWMMVRKLGTGETGQADSTHKVVENELPDGTVERYQYEYKEDPNCRLKRLGILAVDVLSGNQLTASLENIGDLTDRDKLYFVVRKNWKDSDADNLLIIEETAGLLRFRQKAVPLAFRDRGTLTVTDAAIGNLTVTLDATGIDKLPKGRGLFAVIKELADASRKVVEVGWVEIQP